MGSKTFENLEQDKRDRILTTAMDEFAEHGFHQASVNRMVSRLNIAKGSLFKYFGTKEGIFEHVFDYSVGLFSAPLRRIRQETENKDFFERVRLSLLAGVDFIESHPRIYKIYLKILFQENFPLRDKFLSEIRAYSAKYLKSLVRDAVDSGQFRPDLDQDMAVFFLDSVMDRFLQALSVSYLDGETGLFGADREIIENRATQLVEMMRRGLSTDQRDTHA